MNNTNENKGSATYLAHVDFETGRTQSFQEHTDNVTSYAKSICPMEEIQKLVEAAALFHDASEIITGDMPTPVKYLNSDITGSYKHVERLAEEKLLGMLPDELRGAYAEAMNPQDESIRQIVKAADKLSAYIKCVEELRAGNGEFRSAEGQIREALEASSLPEVRYFLKNFMPAFGMTLDELTRQETEA